ncbi:acetyl-CoA carboxylase biotin carboxyl carrier protein [Amycolatopsis granulosa]|uniref:acetyl-CoA carboxylase biotin carboxyl carrier protein n=1 Tax=Amycolatopsis granulosa TaxID=185684 RepID=UPI001421A670|nr:biotin/lipoyl-containing protein [Amycolatopsis granulosa]NIH88277.1 acetyl-CoA carboxylase biotin carboxyl carrier protein [Amycolatopsis granulosa]
MTGTGHTDEHCAILHALAAEVAAVTRLPGTVRRIAMHAAGHSLEVEWTDPEPAAVPGRPSADPVAAATGAVDGVLDGVVVRAPLVGTFFTAPQPGAPAFVAPGDAVEKGQTLAIVEAMKLMNPVLAECTGTVVDVLVGNGEPVEFDQPLVVLAPGTPG